MRTLLIILGVLWASAGQAGELLVIVSDQVPDASISAEQLANIYLLKKNFWADKTIIVPVNREASSEERSKFSEAVFHLTSQKLAEYLDRLRFLGKLPPIVQTSDQAVIGFVRKVPGAIGYISANPPAGSPAPAGVKILMRLP